MGFGERLRQQREAAGLSRQALAAMLGISPSSISNYETGISFPKEEIMLRLFDCLGTEPNVLFQDSFHGRALVLSDREEALLERCRGLSPAGRETVESVVNALCAYRDELEESRRPDHQPRVIPLYRSPAAAGFAAPVCGEDFEYLEVADGVPAAAEFAVRIQGDSMEPWIRDGSVVYVNRDPMREGDVGIFCVDGEILCKQYYRDPLGMVYLFSLNRKRQDADVVLSPGGGRTLACFGRVIMRGLPVPGRD